MHKWYGEIKRIKDYLFPSVGEIDPHQKITDKKWIRMFIPLAPYTAIGICFSILVWGLFIFPSKNYFLNPQMIVFFIVSLWTLLFLLMARFIRKKTKSPAVPLLLANLFPSIGILALILFSGFQSRIQNMRQNDPDHISQTVQTQIITSRASVHRKFEEKEKDFNNHFEKTQNFIRGMGQRMDHNFDLSKKRFLENFEKEWNEKDKRSAENLLREQKLAQARALESEKQWKEIRREQLKNMGLYSEELLEKISPAKRTSDSILQQAEVKAVEQSSPEENSTAINPPFIWDRDSWLKEDELSPSD